MNTITPPASLVASVSAVELLAAVEKSVAREIADKASPETRRSYDHVWRYFRAWLAAQALAPTSVRPRHIQEYVAQLLVIRTGKPQCKGTRGRALSAIRTLYGRLVCDELMAINPAREVKGPKVHSDPTALWIHDEADVEKLLNVPAETWTERRDRLIVRLAFGLGWRRAEVARAAVEDIDGDTISVTVKGSKRRTVGLPDFLAEEIFEWRQFASIQDGTLFPRREYDRRCPAASMKTATVYQMCRAISCCASTAASARASTSCSSSRPATRTGTATYRFAATTWSACGHASSRPNDPGREYQ